MTLEEATRGGERSGDVVRMRRWTRVVGFLVVSIATSARATADVEPRDAAVRQAAADVAVSHARLRELIDRLGSAEPATRRSAAVALRSIGPASTREAGLALAELRKAGSDPGVSAILLELRREGGHEDDLVGALLAAPSPGVSYKTTLTIACLVDALARIGTLDAVREIVLVASDQAGALRPEVRRQVRRLGERATAALILASRDPQRDLARWASGELEAMGKKVPGDAVQTRSNQVLVDVLSAYGATRDLDALSAVLSFTNSDRSQVRDAARGAVFAFGDAALPKVREAYANLLGGAPAPGGPVAEVERALFAEDDRLRLQEVYAVMAAGLSAEAAGDHAAAVDAFERVLSRQPLFERAPEMVPAFVALAKSEEDRDPLAAAAHYRTALRLAPDGPRAAQVTSALDYLEGERLKAHGVTDPTLFERAASADPGNIKAHDELARIADGKSLRELSIRRYEEWGAVAATLLLALIVLLTRRPFSAN
jgi:tetratricopeptide (TPR) repeat protein